MITLILMCLSCVLIVMSFIILSMIVLDIIEVLDYSEINREKEEKGG